MTNEQLLQAVKLACRVMSSTTDDELQELISSAYYDLEISGVANTEGVPYTVETSDALVVTAIKTYCKLHFGDLVVDAQWDRLKASYDEQKAQLKMRVWSDAGLEPGPGPTPTPTDTYVKKAEMYAITAEEIDEYWSDADLPTED